MHINSEWVRFIQGFGLSFRTIVKNDVTVAENGGDVILKGQWVDVNSAIDHIKDAVAKSVCDGFKAWNHANGPAMVERSSNRLNPDGSSSYAITSTPSVAVDANHDRMTAAYKSSPIIPPASKEVLEYYMEIPEYIWHYIAIIYPTRSQQWQQMLSPCLNTRSNMIKLIGPSQVLDDFDKWSKKHDLASVVWKYIDIPSSIDVNLLKMLVDSSEAAELGVVVRLVSSSHRECIGKVSDIDNIISWLKVTLRDIEEGRVTGSGADEGDSAHVNRSKSAQRSGDTVVTVTSHVNSPAASTSPVTHKRPFVMHADRERLKFETAESQLEVEVLKGDITMHQSEVIVNPANKYLLHCGGAAKAIQTAAGQMLVNECKDYIRKNRELPTSQVMHTTGGKLQQPIDYVIHACGPDARVYPDNKQCLLLLEKTFLNCFIYANDKLLVRSLALPAISSGNVVVVQQIIVSMFSFVQLLLQLNFFIL